MKVEVRILPLCILKQNYFDMLKQSILPITQDFINQILI